MQLLAEVGLEEFAESITVDLPYGRKRALEIATTLAMEPELISIAGVYRTSENLLSKDLFGKPALVSLNSGPDGDKLLINPLKN